MSYSNSSGYRRVKTFRKPFPTELRGRMSWDSRMSLLRLRLANLDKSIQFYLGTELSQVSLQKKSASLCEEFLLVHRHVEEFLKEFLNFYNIEVDPNTKDPKGRSYSWHLNLIAAFQTAHGHVLYQTIWSPLRLNLDLWRRTRNNMIERNENYQGLSSDYTTFWQEFGFQRTAILQQVEELVNIITKKPVEESMVANSARSSAAAQTPSKGPAVVKSVLENVGTEVQGKCAPVTKNKDADGTLETTVEAKDAGSKTEPSTNKNQTAKSCISTIPKEEEGSAHDGLNRGAEVGFEWGMVSDRLLAAYAFLRVRLGKRMS